MIYLLDSSVCVPIFNKDLKLAERVNQASISATIAIPAVVVGELSFGACKSTASATALSRLAHLTERFETIPFNYAAVDYYGSIRADLFSKGTPIGPNDFLIAATALARNATLVTRNVREFSRVPALRWVEW